nr:Rho termination factor N-terminal domain-containing protein [Synechococcus sp. N5]
MGLASDLKAAVAAVNETDKKLARLVGQHIEDTAAGLQELRTAIEAKQLAPANFRSLPPAQASELQSLKVPELKAIATRMNLPGRSKAKRKADIVAFLVEHKAPMAPSYEQLLAFWVEHRQ